MKWYNYLACFLAGVFLIHLVPHLLNGFTVTNVVGALVNLGGGSLLLWAGPNRPLVARSRRACKIGLILSYFKIPGVETSCRPRTLFSGIFA